MSLYHIFFICQPLIFKNENRDFCPKRQFPRRKPRENCVAEKEGFEPSRPFRGLHDFQSCALDQLGDFSTNMIRLPRGEQPYYNRKFHKVKSHGEIFITVRQFPSFAFRNSETGVGFVENTESGFFSPFKSRGYSRRRRRRRLACSRP